MVAFLNQQSDPVALLRDRLCMKTLGADATTSVFRDLQQCVPTMAGEVWQGDAVEFMQASLQAPYDALRDMMMKMQTMLQMSPAAGEAITQYLDRLLMASIENMNLKD